MTLSCVRHERRARDLGQVVPHGRALVGEDEAWLVHAVATEHAPDGVGDEIAGQRHPSLPFERAYILRNIPASPSSSSAQYSPVARHWHHRPRDRSASATIRFTSPSGSPSSSGGLTHWSNRAADPHKLDRWSHNHRLKRESPESPWSVRLSIPVSLREIGDETSSITRGSRLRCLTLREAPEIPDWPLSVGARARNKLAPERDRVAGPRIGETARVRAPNTDVPGASNTEPCGKRRDAAPPFPSVDQVRPWLEVELSVLGSRALDARLRSVPNDPNLAPVVAAQLTRCSDFRTSAGTTHPCMYGNHQASLRRVCQPSGAFQCHPDHSRLPTNIERIDHCLRSPVPVRGLRDITELDGRSLESPRRI